MDKGRLEPRLTADGSFSLWSETFNQTFHSGRGALEEAHSTFLAPAGLDRFSPGSGIAVMEVCVGTGTNLAALLDVCAQHQLQLQWWGLESDRRPLGLALADAGFRERCSAHALAELEQLRDHSRCLEGQGQMLWGDARQTLQLNQQQLMGCCDLILHDAFSPSVCPELWSVEFLSLLARCLKPNGRLITYCSAAALRSSLRLLGLQVAGLPPPQGSREHQWSGGTVASPLPLQLEPPLQAFSPMEEEHLLTQAAAPYRDPLLNSSAAEIRAQRQTEQANSTAASTSAWRRRWQGEAGLKDAGRFPPS